MTALPMSTKMENSSMTTQQATIFLLFRSKTDSKLWRQDCALWFPLAIWLNDLDTSVAIIDMWQYLCICGLWFQTWWGGNSSQFTEIFFLAYMKIMFHILYIWMCTFSTTVFFLLNQCSIYNFVRCNTSKCTQDSASRISSSLGIYWRLRWQQTVLMLMITMWAVPLYEIAAVEEPFPWYIVWWHAWTSLVSHHRL